MNIELSLTIIAISLALLLTFAIAATVFLIQLLIVLKKTTQAMEKKVTPLIDDAKKIVNIASDTTQLVKNNFELTTPLFHSIGKISNLMEGFSSRMKSDKKENTVTVNYQARKGDVDFGDWAEWIGMGIVLIQKLRHRHGDEH